MTFDDYALKRLKWLSEEHIGAGPSRFVGRDELEGIIARLEAAENFVRMFGFGPSDQQIQEAGNAWRKAAGK